MSDDYTDEADGRLAYDHDLAEEDWQDEQLAAREARDDRLRDHTPGLDVIRNRPSQAGT